jgi:hypothetical protein
LSEYCLMKIIRLRRELYANSSHFDANGKSSNGNHCYLNLVLSSIRIMTPTGQSVIRSAE